MFGFDKMFDFNRDGRLNAFERAAQFQFMDNMMIHLMMMTKQMYLLKQGLITMSQSLWIQKKEEKCWKTQEWIQMSLIFRKEYQ